MNTESIDKIVSAALEIEEEEAKLAGKLGYMARILVQVTMPHSRSKEIFFERKNGKFSLTISSNPKVGLPYGTYPRLLLAWLVTEAVRTKSPVISLGNSLNNFMSELGLVPSGGRWGTISRLRDQMIRLLSSSISCVYEDEDSDFGLGFSIAKEYRLWRDIRESVNLHHSDSVDINVLSSTVTLSKDFFDEIVHRPVPVDMRALEALKGSSMSIDLYCWLTYRFSYLRKRAEIPWPLLQKQFGSNYANTKQGKYEFKRKLKKQLKNVLFVYAEANVTEGLNGLILTPSLPHIRKMSL